MHHHHHHASYWIISSYTIPLMMTMMAIIYHASISIPICESFLYSHSNIKYRIASTPKSLQETTSAWSSNQSPQTLVECDSDEEVVHQHDDISTTITSRGSSPISRMDYNIPRNIDVKSQEQQQPHEKDAKLIHENLRLAKMIRKCRTDWRKALQLLHAHIGEQDENVSPYSNLVAEEANGSRRSVGTADSRVITSVIQVMGKAGRWEEALALCHDYSNGIRSISNNIDNHNEVFRATIATLGAAGQWKHAIQLLDERAPNPKSVGLYNTAIAACGRGGAWREAIALLNEMELQYSNSNISNNNDQENNSNARRIGYAAAITACARSKQWKEAVSILRQMQRHDVDVTPDITTYNLVLNACGKGLQADMSMQLLQEMMEGEGAVRPNVCTFETVICTCGKVGAWKDASLVQAMLDREGNQDGIFHKHKMEEEVREEQEEGEEDRIRNYLWHLEGLPKVTMPKSKNRAWWKIGQYHYGHHHQSPSSPPPKIEEITIGIQPHRNPRRHGLTLLFYDAKTNAKLGFMLIKNNPTTTKSPPDNDTNTPSISSSLVGMLVTPQYRGLGLAKLFMAIWLKLCVDSNAWPKADKINKPLLALLLHQFGLHPITGGINVELSRGENYTTTNKNQKELLGLYSPSRQHLDGAFSAGDLRHQNMFISRSPPSPRGTVVRVQTSYEYPIPSRSGRYVSDDPQIDVYHEEGGDDIKNHDEEEEECGFHFVDLERKVDQVIQGKNGNGSLNMVEPKETLKEALFGLDALHP